MAVSPSFRLLIAFPDAVVGLDPGRETPERAALPRGRRPTCLVRDLRTPGRAWCGTREHGVLRSDDGGRSWREAGLEGERVTAVSSSPVERDRVWAGTEPSALWSTADAGDSWSRAEGLLDLPSSAEWAFPPRPHTHHVRWIACHPTRQGRLWLAIEAGALVTTDDGGRSWRDRVPGGPRDTHELAVHPDRPDALRVAAGDGYFESGDGGKSWNTPMAGMEVGYLRSVAIDPGAPGVVLVSAARRARSAYVAGRADGRVYRREGDGRWERVEAGWPDPPETIAPLLIPGSAPGELWAADERGAHRSTDGGRSWEPVARFTETPDHLRGLAIVLDP